MNVEELQKLLDVAIFKGCISAPPEDWHKAVEIDNIEQNYLPVNIPLPSSVRNELSIIKLLDRDMLGVFFANLLFTWTLSQAKSRSNGDSDE